MKRSLMCFPVRVSGWVLAATALMATSVAYAQQAGAPPPAATAKVRFETSRGAFTIELDAARAPFSTANVLQ